MGFPARQANVEVADGANPNLTSREYRLPGTKSSEENVSVKFARGAMVNSSALKMVLTNSDTLSASCNH